MLRVQVHNALLSVTAFDSETVSGHSDSEPGLADALIRASDKVKAML